MWCVDVTSRLCRDVDRIIDPSPQQIGLGQFDDFIAAPTHDGLEHVEREALGHLGGDLGGHDHFHALHHRVDHHWAGMGQRLADGAFQIGGVFDADALDAAGVGHRGKVGPATGKWAKLPRMARRSAVRSSGSLVPM